MKQKYVNDYLTKIHTHFVLWTVTEYDVGTGGKSRRGCCLKM